MSLSDPTILATMPTLGRPASEQPKITVIVVGPSGGGVRKTKTALALGAAATAAGRKVLYVCADPGIGSLAA